MLFTLALRNIWRNKRRSLLTLSAMVVSSSLLILSLGIFAGTLRDMLASATEQYHGHLVVSGKGYQSDRDMYIHFTPRAKLLEQIGREKGVTGISPRLRGFGLITHGENTRPAELLGVRPELESKVTTLQNQLVAGGYLEREPGDGAVLGVGLAKKLAVAPGDELIFVTQAADGSLGNDLLVVKGIFATGDAHNDNALVLVGRDWLQRVMVLDGQVHELAISVQDPMEATVLADDLNLALGADLEALDWRKLLPEMRDAIAIVNVSNLVIAVILYLATGLGILNTFFMSVMERTREFGVLMAMGMRPCRIRIMVLSETVLMGAISLIFGVALGLAMTLYMEKVGLDLSAYTSPITYAGGTLLPRLHAVIEPVNIIVPSVLLLLICLAAGFLPANRAAGLVPIQAIREE
jgi:ABC-type lipoprotein release transport system permease subunit